MGFVGLVWIALLAFLSIGASLPFPFPPINTSRSILIIPVTGCPSKVSLSLAYLFTEFS